MEFIKAEEFLMQYVEVQKVFEKWWTDNLQQSDLVKLKLARNKEKIQIIANIDLGCIEKGEIIPLFTEGQLRQFIEDKTGGKLRIIELDGSNYNIVGEHKVFINTNSDLLQAYWKGALEIAKEETHE